MFRIFISMIMILNGEVTSHSAQTFIDSIPDESLEIHISSLGGDLFEGLKIYNAILNHPHETETIVETAGSIASVIALSGDQVSIAKTGSFMIHNALVPNASGNHHDLVKIANTLEKYSSIIAGVYADRTKLSHDEALELMNVESTFTAEESVELGFASKIIEPLKAVAKINKINMGLLETIKKGLTNEIPQETPAVENEAPAVETPEVENALFSPEQLEEIQSMVQSMIAEAMAGNTEEVGATIATVLNSIKSTGSVEQSSGIQESPATLSGIEAFNKKMNEIKSK